MTIKISLFLFLVLASSLYAGGALSFDGVDDYVLVPHDSQINFDKTDDFTVELWFKTTQIPPVDSQLLEKWDGRGSIPYPYVYRIHNDGRLWIGSYSGVSPNWDGVYGGSNVYNGSWHHVAMVRYGTSKIGLFIDGIVAGTNSSLGDWSIANTAALTMGSRGPDYQGAGSLFNGVLDEVRIWNRALSATEISVFYNKHLSGSENGLVAYWNFDEGSGHALTDVTGNGHNGRLGDIGDGDIKEPNWSSNEPPLQDIQTEVSNVVADQRPDDSKLVDIYYDLVNPSGSASTVYAEVSNDGGSTWNVNVTSFTGDIGPGVSPGTGKHIIWDCKADLPGDIGSNYKIRIIADDGN